MMADVPPLRWSALLAFASVACTVDAPDKSIGELTAGPVATAPSSASGDDGDGDSDSGSEGSGGDDDGGSTADGPGDSGVGDASGSGGGTGDEQPADGMYSHCVAANECVGLSACVTAAADDGFCTGACVSPADCDPSPGGNAPPVCALIIGSPASMNGCALDCSLGQMCPGGMICGMVQGVQVCV